MNMEFKICQQHKKTDKNGLVRSHRTGYDVMHKQEEDTYKQVNLNLSVVNCQTGISWDGFH